VEVQPSCHPSHYPEANTVMKLIIVLTVTFAVLAHILSLPIGTTAQNVTSQMAISVAADDSTVVIGKCNATDMIQQLWNRCGQNGCFNINGHSAIDCDGVKLEVQAVYYSWADRDNLIQTLLHIYNSATKRTNDGSNEVPKIMAFSLFNDVNLAGSFSIRFSQERKKNDKMCDWIKQTVSAGLQQVKGLRIPDNVSCSNAINMSALDQMHFFADNAAIRQLYAPHVYIKLLASLLVVFVSSSLYSSIVRT
ncbi:hypothetical protein HK102_003721, partial [Quaeritorhiza haematococci]